MRLIHSTRPRKGLSKNDPGGGKYFFAENTFSAEKHFFLRKKGFFAEKSRKSLFHEKIFSGTRDPARPARSGPGRSGQVRPGRSGRLRTAQVSDFPIISSAARNQPRPAGGRPRLPPAEPGCGVTPNQNDHGTGHGGFGGAKAVGGFFAQRETPGSLERGNVPSSRRVPRISRYSPPGREKSRKACKNHHFPPHPWPPRIPGAQKSPDSPDRAPFKQAVLVQASHRNSKIKNKLK